MLVKRKKTQEISIGNVKIGGNNPISVQSMITIPTSNTDGCIRQISELNLAGADLIRLSVLNQTEAKNLKNIVDESPIPLIADIHFDHKLVIESIDSGVNGVRVNPGNIRNFEDYGKEIVGAAKSNNVPLRIGINAGSLDSKILEKYGEKDGVDSKGKTRYKVTANALVQSAIQEASLFEKLGFTDFKISVKHNDPLTVIEAYRQLSNTLDYPLHLGVTEAGPTFNGLIKSSSTLGILLMEGIGDTIRISLTDDPVQEVKAGCKLLEGLGMRPKTLNIVSCPTCGRTRLDMISLTKKVEKALAGINAPLTVAVMGCEVNGPGEAREADIGIACGQGIGKLFIKGEVQLTLKEDEILDELVKRVREFLK